MVKQMHENEILMTTAKLIMKYWKCYGKKNMSSEESIMKCKKWQQKHNGSDKTE